MVKLQHDGHVFKMTLDPNKIARLGWQKGDELDISYSPDGGLEIHRVRSSEDASRRS